MALTVNQRKEAVSYLTTNCDCWKGKGDDKVLNALQEEKLIALVENAHETRTLKGLVVNGEMPAFIKEKMAAAKGDDEGEEPEAKEEEEKPVGNMTAIQREQAEAKWLASAPAGVREDLIFARNEKAKAKNKLIAQIVANENNPFDKKELAERSISDLTKLAKLASASMPVANYSGAATPIDNEGAAFDDDGSDMVPPTTNWNEVAAEHAKERGGKRR